MRLKSGRVPPAKNEFCNVFNFESLASFPAKLNNSLLNVVLHDNQHLRSKGEG